MTAITISVPQCSTAASLPLLIRGVKIVVTNQAGAVTDGVHNAYNASLTFKETIIEVAGTTGGSQGIYGYNSTAAIIRSNITANGAGTNEGVHNHGGTSYIDHSTITASTATVVNNLYAATSVKARIFASRLAGGVVSYINGAEPDSFSCAGVTNGINTFYPHACP